MKKFLFAVAFCTSLSAGLAVFLFPVTHAAENPLLELLNLPAPPPPNPQVTMMGPTELTGAISYDKSKPPADDAPINVLLDYWRAQSRSYNPLAYKVYPSDKALGRIMAEIEKDPQTITDFLNIFPRNDRSAEFVKDIYDGFSTDDQRQKEIRRSLKQWLKYNTAHFSTELARDASRVADEGDYIRNHDDLLALARVDWDRASPIVNRLYNTPSQPASRTAALWALYLHAIESGSPSDVERYRDELKAIVTDKNLGVGVRDLALDALSLEKEWDGRDEWYLSLLEDESMLDFGRFTGLTTLISNSPQEKYVDRMIALLESDNINVRSAAARNLLVNRNVDRPDVIKALLPWLMDPKWIKEIGQGNRAVLVQGLARVKLPESVPALIAVLDEKGQRQVPMYSNANVAAANAMANAAAYVANMTSTNTSGPYYGGSANSNSGHSTEVFYPLRDPAVSALEFQADGRAVPSLRRILNETSEPYQQVVIVRAMYACGGFSITEQVDSLEEVAKTIDDPVSMSANTVSNMGLPGMNYSIYDRTGKPVIDIKRILGAHLASQFMVPDELVRAVVAKIGIHDKSDAKLAANLRKIVVKWQGEAVNALLLNDLKNGKVDTTAVLRLLVLRKDLREKQQADVFDIRTGGQTAVGIAACILEDTSDYEAILNGTSDEAKIALLACARLIRAPLPINKVAEHFASTNNLLTLAAERYLESEDSPEARRIVLSRHPNEAMILGATTAFRAGSGGGDFDASNMFLTALFSTVANDPVSPVFNYSGDTSSLVETEKRLQEEVKRDTNLIGVYNWKENFIHVYPDRVVMSWHEDQARYRERLLTKEEFDDFKGLLLHFKADELPPFLGCVPYACESNQLLMLGRHGGRRVFVRTSSPPPFIIELDRAFGAMRQQPAVLKYWAAKDVPGLEILYADDRLDAVTVWKNGPDFRLLTAEKARRIAVEQEASEEYYDGPMLDSEDAEVSEEDGGEPQASPAKPADVFAGFTWFSFSGTSLGSVTGQPPGVEFVPVSDGLAVPASRTQWKARAGAIEVRADEKGLYKLQAGKLTKVKTGNYSDPVITSNGRWVVATKYDEDYSNRLVRVNLLNGKEFAVESEEFPIYRAVAFVPALNRVLIGPHPEYYGYHGEETNDETDGGAQHALLDPETGSLIAARGEVRPLISQTFRPLQPATSAFEYWAAMPKGTETVIGIYNSRFLNFKPLLTLPKLNFDSMTMWVDDAAGKAYFVYEGHLLAVPVKAR